MTLSTNNGNIVLSPGSGNVGIGTAAAPAEKLDVAGNIKSDGLNKIIFLRPLGPSFYDSAQINNEIAGLAATHGGIIMLGPGEYRINTTINLNVNGVKLRGYGAAGVYTGLSELTPTTKLLWAGAAGGTVVGVDPGAGTWVADVEISHLTIDGAYSAAAGLLLHQVRSSRFVKLNVRHIASGNPQGTGIKLTADTGDNVLNYFESCSVDDAALGLVLDGSATHDCTQNLFVDWWVRYWGDAGIWLKHADANVFTRVSLERIAGTGHGVVVESPGDVQANYFYHLAPSGGFLVRDSTHPPHSEGKNVVFGYTIGDNQPPPETDASSVPPERHVAWVDALGNMAGFLLKHYSIASPLSSSNWPLVTDNQIASCWDTANLWLLVQQGGNKWKLRMELV
jgi:hypothetical protein